MTIVRRSNAGTGWQHRASDDDGRSLHHLPVDNAKTQKTSLDRLQDRALQKHPAPPHGAHPTPAQPNPLTPSPHLSLACGSSRNILRLGQIWLSLPAPIRPREFFERREAVVASLSRQLSSEQIRSKVAMSV